MKNFCIKGALLVIAILLSCNLFFYIFRIPELKKKISKVENDYAELYKTNENCEANYKTETDKSKDLEIKIAEQEATIANKDKTIADKNAEIKKLNQEITNLKK